MYGSHLSFIYFLYIVGVKPGAKYTKLTEHARSLISAEKQCSMFCGGKKCKYCRPDHWKDDQMGVKGIYSHW